MSADSWAEVYDIHTNPTRDLAAVVLRQTWLDLAGRDVLEIGCGTGANTQWLLDQSQSVLALDFSREMRRPASGPPMYALYSMMFTQPGRWRTPQ
jgi:2-polyprenyl-3-methyl-5-hydroxy-6-metoxy-1,4-benzoquinol methylase